MASHHHRSSFFFVSCLAGVLGCSASVACGGSVAGPSSKGGGAEGAVSSTSPWQSSVPSSSGGSSSTMCTPEPITADAREQSCLTELQYVCAKEMAACQAECGCAAELTGCLRDAGPLGVNECLSDAQTQAEIALFYCSDWNGTACTALALDAGAGD